MNHPKNIHLLILLAIIPASLFSQTETKRSFFFGSSLAGTILYTENNNITDIITDLKIGYFISKKSALRIGLDLDFKRSKSEGAITNKTYTDFTLSYGYHSDKQLVFEVLFGFGKYNYNRMLNTPNSYFHCRFKLALGCEYPIFITPNLALTPGIYIGKMFENLSKYEDYDLNLFSSFITPKVGLFFYY